MDNLKKYLQENKAKMDVDVPRDAVWEAIQQKTNTKKIQAATVKMAVRYLAAACVLTAIILGFKWIIFNNKIAEPNKISANTLSIKKNTTSVVSTIPVQKTNGDTAIISPKTEALVVVTNNKKKKNNTAKSINPIIEKENQAIDHLENGYAQMVKLQLNRIRNTPVFAEGPSYFNSFKTQLQQMDKDENEIKKFIKTNGLTDELLEQLINVSQQKLTLLKNLQTEINKMNTQVKENQSPADSTKSFYLHI